MKKSNSSNNNNNNSSNDNESKSFHWQHVFDKNFLQGTLYLKATHLLILNDLDFSDSRQIRRIEGDDIPQNWLICHR